MKIIRFIEGKKYEFELTSHELQTAWEERNTEALKENFQNVAETFGTKLSSDEMEEAIQKFDGENSEGWFAVAENIINKIIEERAIDDDYVYDVYCDDKLIDSGEDFVSLESAVDFALENGGNAICRTPFIERKNGCKECIYETNELMWLM